MGRRLILYSTNLFFSGCLDAYMLEFDLNLDENIDLEVSGDRQHSCWPQAFFPSYHSQKITEKSVVKTRFAVFQDLLKIETEKEQYSNFISLPPLFVLKVGNFNSELFENDIHSFLNQFSQNVDMLIYTSNLQIISEFCYLTVKNLINNLIIVLSGEHFDSRSLKAIIELVELYGLDKKEKVSFVQNYLQLSCEDEITHSFIEFSAGDGNILHYSLYIWSHLNSIIYDLKSFTQSIEIGVQLFQSERLRSMVILSFHGFI